MRMPAIVKQLAARLLGRTEGELRPQDLRRMRDVLRFSALFASTILLPALLLSALALSSIRSQVLAVDAELRSRANATSEQVQLELARIFDRFEAATQERLARNESPLNNLGELSPYLRGAYRFDAAGALAAPVELGALPQPVPAPLRFRNALRAGRAAEAEADWRRAAAHYERAAGLSTHPIHVAEARLARARVIGDAGGTREAEQAYSDVYGDFAAVRDERGFRVGDLALLKGAELRLAREPDVGSVALQNLVEQLLDSPWTVGLAGEATVVRRAIGHLEGAADPDWLARTRARLNERTDQLYWAEIVAAELELVAVPTPEGDFRYAGARIGSPSIWATVQLSGDLYAFSFSAQSLFEDLSQAATRIGALEEDLIAELLLPGQPQPMGVFTVEPLGPWLPTVTAVVRQADPKQLAERKDRARLARLAVVTVAVFMVAVGVVFSARIIGREVENARIKADFAANVSHELRSPITQIRLKGEALQLGLVDPGEDTQQHYDAIVHEAERLSRLVDNVLDFAAIERGAKKYSLRPDDLTAIVYHTVEATRSAVEARGLELIVDLPEDLPVAWVDREAVGQVLTNLLSNAAKYGADGGYVGVRVRVGLEGIDVSVWDRGIGIDPKDQAQIFEHFYRSNDPNVRRRKGTGIGLTIVRYIVEAHGGSVSVESRSGVGTTFTVTFPLEPPAGVGAKA